jgi:glycosyltransferase involved in cell wall biosynthesis
MSDSASVDVTVVVPCYNHGGFLREAIESAEKSHGVRFEIVVVDDGSTDEATLGVMAELRRDGYQVIRHDENRGVSAARNTGLPAPAGATFSRWTLTTGSGLTTFVWARPFWIGPPRSGWSTGTSSTSARRPAGM